METYNKNTRKILSGAAWLTISAVILKIIGLVYKIPMSYILGDEGMGYFNSAYTVYTLFYILGSAGIGKAVSILCAKSSLSESKAIFSIIFKFYFFIGIVLSLILILFSKTFSILISNENSFYTILAISPSVFFVCLSGVLRGYLNGKTKFVPVAISEMIGGISKLFLGLILAKYATNRGFSLPTVSAFSILGITLGSVFGFLYLKIYYAHESRDIKKEILNTKIILKEILKIGIPIMLASALSTLVNIIDLSVIMNRLKYSGYTESVSTVIYGNYTTLAVPMFTFVTTLINTVTLASLPIIAAAFSKRKMEEMKLATKSTLVISLFISIPSFAAFLFFPFEILSLIFEASSAALGAGFLCCLAPGILFYSILMYANTVLEGTGRVKCAVGSLIFGALIKCILSYVLIGNENFGALGAPIGTSVSYMASALISLYFLNKKLNIDGLPCATLLDYSIVTSLSLVFTIILKHFLITQNIVLRAKSLIILSVFAFFYITFTLFLTIIKGKQLHFIVKINKKQLM